MASLSGIFRGVLGASIKQFILRVDPTEHDLGINTHESIDIVLVLAATVRKDSKRVLVLLLEIPPHYDYRLKEVADCNDLSHSSLLYPILLHEHFEVLFQVLQQLAP